MFKTQKWIVVGGVQHLPDFEGVRRSYVDAYEENRTGEVVRFTLVTYLDGVSKVFQDNPYCMGTDPVVHRAVYMAFGL